jgi:hypothetical protein
MNALELNTKVAAQLMATQLVPDQNKPGESIIVSFPCNLKGQRLGAGEAPVPVYKDLYSGKVYAKVAEVIPSATDPASAERAKELHDMNPIHFSNEDGSVNGWFIEAPSFDESLKAAA